MLNSIDIISSKRGSCFLWINNILSKTWDSTLGSTSIEVILLLIKTQQNCTVIKKFFVILKESFHNYLCICVCVIYIQIRIVYNAKVCFPLWHMIYFLYHQKILSFFVYIIPFYIEFCHVLNIFSYCVLRLNKQLSINSSIKYSWHALAVHTFIFYVYILYIYKLILYIYTID